MALELANGVVVPDTPTLHRQDGSKFDGDVAVQQLLIDYDRRNPEIVFLADGTRAFSEIGDPQRWIDSFQLVAFHRNAVQQIKNAIADEVTQGVFKLHIPHIEGSGEVDLDVRFFDAPFVWTIPRRRGYPTIFTADVTEIDVL